MPPLDRSRQYAQALLDHVQTGAYPSSEDVVSAELPSSALPVVSKTIDEAREELRRKVRLQSKDIAPDIDGWISRAKQLQVDIKASQAEAQDIVQEAQHGRELRESVNDSESKVRLLEEELAFNHSLEVSLGRLRAVGQQLDRIQQAIVDSDVLNAVDLLCDFDEESTTVSGSPASKVANLFSAKAAQLHTEAAEDLQHRWKSYVHTDKESITISIRRKHKNAIPLDLESVVLAQRKLGTLDQALLLFCKEIEQLILLPRLHVRADGLVFHVESGVDYVRTVGPTSDLSAKSLFSELSALLSFLDSKLPQSAVESLSAMLMPNLLSRLITTWLASAVPDDLDGINDFRDTQELAIDFGQYLEASRWPGKAEIDEWLDSIPVVWLKKRQESALNRVRKLVPRGIQSIETVERIETQIMSHEDDVFPDGSGGNEWNANWSDEEDDPTAEQHHPEQKSQNISNADVSAWGFDDEKVAPEARGKPTTTDEDDSAEAWGWGDDDEQTDQQNPDDAAKASPTSKIAAGKQNVNGTPQIARKNDREITLKETYTITSLPKEVLNIIAQVTADLDQLRSPAFANSPLAGSAPALSSLSSLILAMYRASSPSAYEVHNSGNMYLYNDCQWLAEQLRPPDRPQDPSTASSISALETHGKRAYAKEMDSQRTILADQLDGAEGFKNCTEYPFNQQCDTAISSTIDRIRQLHQEWKPVLSQSALMQAMGSLLSSVCSKFIVDVEEMEDISEPESQQLTAYCSRLGSLENIFRPNHAGAEHTASSPGSEEAVLLTAVYTRDWLKFQYLANILESKLVDIKYMWTEGELQLEFETQEVVDLIEALFAESSYRKGAIGEIRAAERRRG
ncbi:uncharacterized protein KY384_009132 [Bacidia gigantensis]|uniref:uncharacterized protein n=1 Tax=Bacidia gigantensis TaxID=2732470 RepID=UPI001D04A1E3|nr:uncharacterized protein KY384_009132 [Bacidia gigantensis]KAG8525488.1 hypothetical protein KY384_009132 [Bacidia gigantensis]